MELVENNPQSIIFHIFQYVIGEHSNLKFVELKALNFRATKEIIFIKKLLM